MKLPTLTHPEQTMNTFKRYNTDADFVSTDTAALASHMGHCASKRSRFFGLHAALELAHSAVFSRMVTASLLAAVLLALVGMI